MALPGLILTGASGFLGRHLLAAIAERYRVFGIARRSQVRSGAPEHPNITWFQVDIGERAPLETVFRRVQEAGGAETVVHLAAHYDFTGEEHPEYERTNVLGLRNTLELSRQIGVRSFVFSSSVAACKIPPAGRSLTEASPPDGLHIYARTKRQGEEMVASFDEAFSTVIVRFAAMFSDWCEYPPLFFFLSTWLSSGWNARILGGKGLSAIPYLHVRDGVTFLRTVLGRLGSFAPGEVLIASPDGATAHLDLYETATTNYFNRLPRPLMMPRLLCGPGMWVRDVAGRITADRPFERPWMASYIDTVMSIDAARTRARLHWSPRPRLLVLRRLPFLIDNFKTDPLEWNRKNRAALKEIHVPSNLKLHRLLERHEDEILAAYGRHIVGPEGPARFESYQRVSAAEHEWNHRVILRHLMNAVRTREKGLLLSYVRDLARRRFEQGFRSEEVCGAIEALNLTCLRVLRRDPEAEQMREAMIDFISMPILFSCDEIQEVFELLEAERSPAPVQEEGDPG